MRLIDANELLRFLENEIDKHENSLNKWERDYVKAIKVAAKILRCFPTVDAVEVVHGRWENVQETEMYVPDMKLTITKTAETCSECKARIGFVGAKQYLFDTLCPNCGAKMDLEVSDGKA